MLRTRHQSPGPVTDSSAMCRETMLSAPESNNDGGSAAKRFWPPLTRITREVNTQSTAVSPLLSFSKKKPLAQLRWALLERESCWLDNDFASGAVLGNGRRSKGEEVSISLRMFSLHWLTHLFVLAMQLLESIQHLISPQKCTHFLGYLLSTLSHSLSCLL